MMQAKRALGLSSNEFRSKDQGTHTNFNTKHTNHNLAIEMTLKIHHDIYIYIYLKLVDSVIVMKY